MLCSLNLLCMNSFVHFGCNMARFWTALGHKPAGAQSLQWFNPVSFLPWPVLPLECCMIDSSPWDAIQTLWPYAMHSKREWSSVPCLADPQSEVIWRVGSVALHVWLGCVLKWQVARFDYWPERLFQLWLLQSGYRFHMLKSLLLSVHRIKSN